MKLILGLGNPSDRYNFTRHNFGFLALDFYCKIYNISWEKSPKFAAVYTKFEKNGEKILFLKPMTFYNEVGKSAREFTRYYKIPPENLLAVCDDFNLSFGATRFREKGSAGGNNGLKSLIAELKTEDFPRLRLGTANDDLRKRLGDTDFVLSRFTPDEQSQLPKVLKEITSRLDDWLN